MKYGLLSPDRLVGALMLVMHLAGGLPAGERLHTADRSRDRCENRRSLPQTTDSEFLRRVSLDLAGMIPTSEDAHAFLDDPSPYKRRQLVDRLLASPGSPPHAECI